MERQSMSVISVVLTLVLVGFLLWLVNTYILVNEKTKRILNIVVMIAVVLWVLSAFGALGQAGEVWIPRIQ